MGLVIEPTWRHLLTVADAKEHLRIDVDAPDDVLPYLIAAATQYVENETRQQLCATTATLILDAFPTTRVLRLPKPPLRSVTSVKYRNPSGVTQTFDASLYFVDAASKPGTVALLPGASWPQTDQGPGAVTVEFSIGYADNDDVPDTLLLAVKLLVGHWFENREAATDRRIDTVPLAVESLLLHHTYPEAV